MASVAETASVVASHLELALARIADLEDARAHLVSAWAAAPHERTSRLVELVDAKLDAVLPYQLANLGSVPARKAPVVLAAIRPDPRVAHELLGLLAKPPWRANPTLPFWRACCARIVATCDARVLARLEEVALGYPATISTSVGHKVAGYLDKAAGELRGAIDALPDLGERVDEACTALEAKLGAKPAKRTLDAELTDELLAAVYATPADDAPRMVLADHLMQRGDPRGEFINLQLARAAGRSDDTTRARELELLAASNGQWTGRIGMALEPERFAFHRGFVGYAQLPRTRTRLAQFATDPAWNTIELLDISWSRIAGGDRDAFSRILTSITSRSLRGVLGVPAKFLATLDAKVLARLERIDALEIATAAEREVVLAWLAAATRPHTLGISVGSKRNGGVPVGEATRRADLAPILASPAFGRLQRLILHTHEPQTWLGMLEATALPVLVLAMSNVRVELVREGRRFARALLHQSNARHAAYPEAITRHFARLLEGRALVVDARDPFYPGLHTAPTWTKHWPLLEGIVDDLAWLGR